MPFPRASAASRLVKAKRTDIPADKKPVRVTGSDPYGLDRDGDGYGCEG